MSVFLCSVLSLLLTAGEQPEVPRSDETRTESFIQLRDQREQLEAEIVDLQEELDTIRFRFNVRLGDEQRVQGLKEELDKLEKTTPPNQRKIADARRELEYYESKLASAGAVSAADLANQLNATTGDLKDRRAAKSQVETKIDRLLSLELVTQEFKRNMSYSFGGLVALLLVGYLVIAGLDPSVRLKLFSPPTALQMLTLFSVIIAIILFGITGVMDERSLSALLGSLIGFILGKFSQSSPNPPDQDDGAGEGSTSQPDVPRAQDTQTK